MKQQLQADHLAKHQKQHTQQQRKETKKKFMAKKKNDILYIYKDLECESDKKCKQQRWLVQDNVEKKWESNKKCMQKRQLLQDNIEKEWESNRVLIKRCSDPDQRQQEETKKNKWPGKGPQGSHQNIFLKPQGKDLYMCVAHVTKLILLIMYRMLHHYNLELTGQH